MTSFRELPESLALRALTAILDPESLTSTGIQSHGEHDFDVRYADGRTAIVEVAMIADEGMKRLIAAVTSPVHGGELASVKQARDGWYVVPREGARVNDIRRKADQVLSLLDAAQIETFDLEYLADETPAPLAAKLRALGLIKGDVVGFVPPRKMWIGLPSFSGCADPAAVSRAVLDVSCRPDNLRKLNPGKSAERHLFVYVDGTANDAQLALLFCEPTHVPAALPAEVTHIWIGTYTGTVDRAIVWGGARGGSFTRYQLDLPPANG